MDLYSLPKDMLVKLISTIREDTIKEITSKYREKIDFVSYVLESENETNSLTECDFPGCNSMEIGITNEDYSFGCKYMIWCNKCSRYICDRHPIKTEIGCIICAKNVDEKKYNN